MQGRSEYASHGTPKRARSSPKTRTSRRTTPVPGAFAYSFSTTVTLGSADDGLLFAGADGTPFHAASLYRRADRAWAAAGLTERLRLHQARHTYASFMIAAGVNAKALSVFMGHSSIKVTFDLYGHLMPGTEAEAAALLDTFLGGQVGQAPGAVTHDVASVVASYQTLAYVLDSSCLPGRNDGCSIPPSRSSPRSPC